MRFIKAVLVNVIMLLLLVGCVAQDSQQQTETYIDLILAEYPELEGKPYTREAVSRIIDGDTFVLANEARVRLIGVNTPEITNGKSEPYGQEAKLYAEEVLLQQTVLLFQDVSETDRYGRWLRYVFVEPEVRMFNEALVAEGYANTMTYPPDVTYADRFLAYEQEARADSRGLWGEEQLSEQTREQVQSLSCTDPQIKGNINSRNERIYHIPGSSYYEVTIAEMMFCTIEEAEEAGFRAPKR